MSRGCRRSSVTSFPSSSSGGGGAYTRVSDESELATALADSASMILLTSSFTLTADKNVLVDTEIKAEPGVTVTMGAFVFIVPAATDIYLDGGSYAWTRTFFGFPFTLGAGATLKAFRTVFDNTSTTNNAAVASGAEQQEFLFTQHTSSRSGGGIGAFGFCRVMGSTFTHAGAGNNILSVTGVCFITDVLINGSTTSNALSVNIVPNASGQSFVKGFRHESTHGVGATMIVRSGLISQFYVSEALTINFSANLASEKTTISGVVAPLATVNLAPSTDLQVFGLECDTIQFPAFEGCRVFGANVVSAATFDTPFGEIHGGHYAGGLTVNGDDMFVQGATIGDRAGGGALTLTINAGSDRTRVVGVATDAAIVDNGTGTVTAANTVF